MPEIKILVHLDEQQQLCVRLGELREYFAADEDGEALRALISMLQKSDFSVTD